MGVPLYSLPKKAKDTALAISKFCEDQPGVWYEFQANNGHPSVLLKFKGVTRRMNFSGTPSDRNAHKAAVRQLKRVLTQMGWSDTQKDIGMKSKPQAENLFKKQKVSEGAASPVVSIDPKIVRGIAIPTPKTGDVHARNEAILKGREAGATDSELHKAVKAAGWMVSKHSLTACCSKAKNIREGLPAAANRTGQKRSHTKRVAKGVEVPKPNAPKIVRSLSDLPILQGTVIAGVQIPLKGQASNHDRNEAMLVAAERGALNEDIHKAVTAAGWKIKERTVAGSLTRARNIREGRMPHEPRNSYSNPTQRVKYQATQDESRGEAPIEKSLEVNQLPSEALPSGISDDIALEIAQAIAPVIKAHLIGMGEEVKHLKAQNEFLAKKAAKFDQLKQLMN